MALLVFGAGACGDDGNTDNATIDSSGDDAGAAGDSASASGMSIEEYCTERVAIHADWCRYLDECCTSADTDDIWFLPPACSSSTDRDIRACIDEYQPAEGESWNGTTGAACLNELKNRIPSPPTSCSGLRQGNPLTGHDVPALSQHPACFGLYEGTKEVGEECESGGECARGLTCNKVSGTSSGQYRCEEPGKLGTECVVDSNCEVGLFCVGDLPRRCQKLLGIGSRCLYTYDCENGLQCDRTCKVPLLPGASCGHEPFNCSPGYGCSYATNTCVLAETTGKDCTYSSECSGRCDPVTKKCVEMCGGPG